MSDEAKPTGRARSCLGGDHCDMSSPDIEPQVIRDLALAADAIQSAARHTQWGYVSDHCANALAEIKKAIKAACGAE